MLALQLVHYITCIMIIHSPYLEFNLLAILNDVNINSLRTGCPESMKGAVEPKLSVLFNLLVFYL